MPDRSNAPQRWLAEPPATLVLGDGPYAQALSMILGAAILSPKEVQMGPAANETGAFPQVLRALGRVFLVAGSGQTAADLLRLHDGVWEWVQNLCPEKDQHELAILFVLPLNGDPLGRALAAGLGLEHFENGLPGHGVARIDDSLAGLLKKAASIVPQDLPPLRARQAADERHAALAALRQATSDELLGSAARRVVDAFRDEEYLLDLFCHPPSHRNGNQLRRWLNGIVTRQVTHHDEGGLNEGLLDWLDPDRP